ncbi:MAG: DUF4268 domain-containing protein [Rhizomicrobium sp.]
MAAIIPLGTLERVAITDAWPTEHGNFTKWLAEAIALLGHALKLSLEVDGVEKQVGDFRADIVARVAGEPEEHLVIIENQFGRTDHGHLGQILTYLAGVESAKTIVWVAEEVRQDHRAAIDWLNSNTSEEFSFFAVEVELWRIGMSSPAPKFNVVSSPNDWARDVRAAARQITDKNLAERHQVRLAYWAAFSEFLRKANSTFRINRPNKDHWKWFAIGRTGFGISATISTEKERIGVELYASDDINKIAYNLLHSQKEAIEREFGEPLEWQELPGRKAIRIALYKRGVDPSDAEQYPALHSWMLEKMNRFKRVFAARVQSLPLRETDDAEESSEEHAE